ncbi:MAG: cytochrome c nitrite reductase small subunit [Actinomycetaceae bacterium]|nr:cytochrome c nitrite reductase small subunit [Actinomycetaceae bacterium]MDU0969786.1 cytochrome c nitrite reductase small subunit [Actinomycetaceae bacterium]
MSARSLSQWLTLRRALAIIAIWVVGSLIGVGIFTLVYGKAYSYLGSNPETCTNCHVMDKEYDAWVKGSHHNVATCNDCHTPHDSIVHKYWVKADDGVRHGYKFATNTYPENIQIRDVNLKITNEACLHCHAGFTSSIHQTLPKGEQLSCVHCHRDVGHK